MVSYKARFTNVNDPYMRYVIVCVDKTWGQPGCQPWTGDWVQVVGLSPGDSIESPYFTPTNVLTAVTSSDAGYYYRVDIIDENGNIVYTCDQVDRNNPCYFYVAGATTSTTTISTTSSTTTTTTTTSISSTSPTTSSTTTTSTTACPAVGNYGVISVQPVTDTWTVGQPLQITLEMCSISPPPSDVPIDVSAGASICYQADFGDLGYLAYYPANQSQATITITLPALLTPDMCPAGTYNGTLNLRLTVEDPGGSSNILLQIPLTFVFPGMTTTTMPTQITTLTTTEASMLAPTTPITTTSTTTSTTVLAGVPPTKAAMYIAMGAAVIIALAGLGYYLYSRKKR